MTSRMRAFTIIELMVVISIIALLIAILLPAIGKARDAALTTRSLANMRNLAAAHGAYSAEWGDRQWTAVPDDIGLYSFGGGGACQQYIANAGCPPALVLGWDADVTPSIWGAFLGCGGISEGNCNMWFYYQPLTFTGSGVGFGSFRLINAESFNSYLNGRFYDPIFYAPKDNVILAGAEKYFALPDAFTVIPPDGTGLIPQAWYSSYCCSPAAMWNPDVLSLNKATNKYYTNPDSLPAGYKSPPAGAATYPDLKTRMLEHSWLQQKPNSDVNPNFAGGQTPWYFNHGFKSAPATLFYDGHVRVVGCGDAMDADGRAKAAVGSSGVGLWSRDTPGGPGGYGGVNGYYGNAAYDFTVDTSFHILTIDGILGRDVIGVK